MSTKNTVFRGSLKDKTALIALFKAIDEHTEKKFLGLPYYDPNSKFYGKKTQFKGYRPMFYGSYQVLMKQFNVTRPTIFARMQKYKDGVDDSSKTTQAGTRPVSYTRWELTPAYALIKESIGADANSVKANIRNPSRYPVTYTKQKKYAYTCYLAWLAMGGKVDLLAASLDDWFKVWGKDPKSPNQCYSKLRDSATGLVAFGHSIPLRWIMKHSHDPQVKNTIVIGDERFNTKSLKREKGQHKASYFTEEQCLLLPQALPKVDSNILSFCGDLFGGRISALLDLTPAKIDFVAKKITFFETKIQRNVEKPLFEPELSFLRQYIMDFQIPLNKPLFPRTAAEYNKELSATKQFFAKTDYPLNWTPTTHTAFKHTCVTQMSLHGVRMDTISDYIGTDPNTLKEFYRGGSDINIQNEIGGMNIKQANATWRDFVIQLTKAYAARYTQLTGRQVNLVLPSKGAA